MIPKVTLTGNADGFVKIYYAFFGLIILIVLYFIAKSAGKASVKKEEKEKYKPNANALSYDVSQYDLFADTLEKAMNPVGTDEAAIYNVFSRMKSNDDVKQVITSFGERLNFSSTSIRKHDLPYWLRDELNKSELNKLNGILRANKITITF